MMSMGPESRGEPEGTPRLEGFHEVIRCVRRDEVRSYRMRAIGSGAELWRVTESEAAGVQAVKESDFKSSEEAAAFLEELRRSLIAGGWREP
jgi:hypothetical protein